MAKLELRGQRLFDYLSNYRFHLFDVTLGGPPVLNISYGFARVSMPETTVEMKEIKEGVLEYKHYVPIGATISPITLERGVSVFNSDFNDWARAVIKGVPNQRRNLMLVQFSEAGFLGSPSDTGKASLGLDLLNQFINFGDLFSRVPGRAWMLYGCLPTTYKAGSDLDALGNEISIAQLTVQPHIMTEITLGVF